MSAQASPLSPLSPSSVGGSADKNSTTTQVRLAMEIVRVKRIPPREFEPAASPVVSLHPTLVSYARASPSGSGSAAAAALTSSSAYVEVPDTAPIAPPTFDTQQQFNDNDAYFNDKIEFVVDVPNSAFGGGAAAGGAGGGLAVGTVQGFPAGVTLPPLRSASIADADGKLPTIPKPPNAMANSVRGGRKSVVSASSLAPPVLKPTAITGEAESTSPSHAGGLPPAPPSPSAAAASLLAASAANQAPQHQPHFRVPIIITDHSKPATPLVVLYGMLDIPATQTKNEVTINVALSGDKDAVSSATISDSVDVLAPLLTIRYRVNVPKPPKEVIDYHADVLLEKEPVFNPEFQLVPDVTQFSWYHLLNDRPWLQHFSHALIQQWSALPKIVFEDEAARKSSPSKKEQRPPTGSRGRVAAQVSYKSIADLMLNHWSVKRSHEALTKMRMVADKYNKNEPMAFTALEEYTLKLQWRERQVLRTTLAIDLLSADYSNSPVRALLDRLWLNMVYSVPADAPNPPAMTYDIRSKLATIAFTAKHAAILRACMLQQLVHGLTYNDALKIATDDFEAKNVTYVSRRGSLIGGEYSKSEAIMMAFGTPNQPSMPPPLNPVPEMEQLSRLIEDNKNNLKVHSRRSRSHGKRGDGTNSAEGAGAAEGTLGATTVASMLAGTMGGSLNMTMAEATGIRQGTHGAVGPNGVPLKEEDLPTPMKYTSQKVFTTVVIDFIGRLLETLTDHEFIMLINAFIPAITAASEKCLMVSSGIPSMYKPVATAKRAGSAKKKRASSAAKTKKSAQSATTNATITSPISEAGRASVASNAPSAAPSASPSAADGKHTTTHLPAVHSGPVKIDYLDSLGRRLPKVQAGGGGSAIPAASPTSEEGAPFSDPTDSEQPASPTTGDEGSEAGGSDDGASQPTATPTSPNGPNGEGLTA